jgi:hypothetical protein
MTAVDILVTKVSILQESLKLCSVKILKPTELW